MFDKLQGNLKMNQNPITFTLPLAPAGSLRSRPCLRSTEDTLPFKILSLRLRLFCIRGGYVISSGANISVKCDKFSYDAAQLALTYPADGADLAVCLRVDDFQLKRETEHI